jgi:hypothetical protein
VGDTKPNPLQATTPQELQEQLAAYWQWAGMPSSREISRNSRNAISHTTAAKILRRSPSSLPCAS